MADWVVNPGKAAKPRVVGFVTYLSFAGKKFIVCMFTLIRTTQGKIRPGSGGVWIENGDARMKQKILLRDFQQ
jgi:hypothetical protein